MHTIYYIIRAYMYNNIKVPIQNSMHKRPDRIAARRRRPIVSERVFIAAAQTAANPDCRAVTIFLFFFFFRFFFFIRRPSPSPHPYNVSTHHLRAYVRFFSRFRKTVVYCLNQFCIVAADDCSAAVVHNVCV